ncbi:MAG: serine hydrolase [Verrucomicrobiota bacterium]|nr:serine hydrolase [Verrucomicrobiota bacterium]
MINRLSFLILVLALGATVSAHADGAAYLVVDSQTGYVLQQQNAKEKKQVGSLTKIATACVVLDWAEKKGGDLNQIVTVPQIALAGIEKNEIGLQPGDTISLRDLLYAALIQSDNVAANVLAAHVGEALAASGIAPAGGAKQVTPTAVFVGQMNALAKSLKMERTRFSNPTGFDQTERPTPYSTASDMARLTRYALQKASFRFYVSQKERVISITRAGKAMPYTLHTTNDLLGSNGIDGVKTGQTAKAGECVILSSRRESEIVKEGAQTAVYPRHIIVVLLGSTDRFGMGERLIAQGWRAYDQWAAAGRLVSPERVLN